MATVGFLMLKIESYVLCEVIGPLRGDGVDMVFAYLVLSVILNANAELVIFKCAVSEVTFNINKHYHYYFDHPSDRANSANCILLMFNSLEGHTEMFTVMTVPPPVMKPLSVNDESWSRGRHAGYT